MDSDDSAASEVASDVDVYEDSFVADEIDEDDVDERGVASKHTGPGPVPPATTSKSEADDEAEDDAYSVDFEEADEITTARPTKQRSSSRSNSPTRRDAPAAIAEDAEYAYSEASFEDESKLSQSLNRLVVDLSVPVRRDSAGSASSNSPQHKSRLNPNSPHVNLKVLSKPSPVRAVNDGDGGGGGGGGMPPTVAPAQQLAASAWTLLEQESDRSLSLLLRKVESKYQDELEELREKNALLTWKERELKTELRILKDESKMRKSRLDKKRQRAAERRREADGVVERLRLELSALSERVHAADRRLEQQLLTNEALRAAMAHEETERRRVETRNLEMAERLQQTLSDFHALNLKYEAAVGSQLAAERRAEELASQHKVESDVVAHKARVEVAAAHETLALERAAWQRERETLPAAHSAMVQGERERIEKLEAHVQHRVREMEAQLARETVRFEKELATAWEAKRAAEERGETRLRDELAKLARERDALDAQRRELVVAMTRGASRNDDERARLDVFREQLDVQRLRLVEERAELDARTAYAEDRVQRLAQDERVLDARRAELTKLGRETLDKSRVLAQRMEAFGDMKKELETLRAAQQQREADAAQLQQERVALEKAARQLQHERLAVATQRAQSRQLLHGAKKLELLLHQQKALEKVAATST